MSTEEKQAAQAPAQGEVAANGEAAVVAVSTPRAPHRNRRGRTRAGQTVHILLMVLLSLLLLLALVFAFTAFCNAEVSIQGATIVDDTNGVISPNLPKLDVAVVPGAAVWGDNPSPVLQERCEAGADLYRSGVVKQLFLSGAPNETAMMVTYLTQRTNPVLPASALVVDNAGLDTYDSVVRADEFCAGRGFYFLTEEAFANRAGYLLQTDGSQGRVLTCDLYHIATQPDDAVHEYLAASKAWLERFFNHREAVPDWQGAPLQSVSSDGSLHPYV
jgi:vancomycin permeability regulator SanA